MGLFGGSSQSTATSSNILDFNPVFNIGDGNTSAQDKTLDATQTVTPKLDDSTGISGSVGLGFGGSGSGGTAQTSRTNEDVQPLNTAPATSNLLSGINTSYLIYGAVGLVGLVFLSRRKKR